MITPWTRTDRDVLDRLRDNIELLERLMFYYERGFTTKIRSDVKMCLEKSKRAFNRKCDEVAIMMGEIEDSPDDATQEEDA